MKKVQKKNLKVRLNKEQEKSLIDNYKDGWDLIELERFLGIDQSLIFEYIKKRKFKESTFNNIYKKQEDRTEKYKKAELLRQERLKIREKFFPFFGDHFSYRHYLYWYKKIAREEKEKARCGHKVKHIRCALCKKILADASKIKI